MSQISPEAMFTRLLFECFKNPMADLSDIAGQGGRLTLPKLNVAFKDMITSAQAPVLLNLKDKNGLSILGYMILTKKRNAFVELINTISAEQVKSSGMLEHFNKELEFIFTHRVDTNPVYGDPKYISFTEYINFFKDYGQFGNFLIGFKISDRNLELAGYRLMIETYPGVFQSHGHIRIEDFVVPKSFEAAGSTVSHTTPQQYQPYSVAQTSAAAPTAAPVYSQHQSQLPDGWIIQKDAQGNFFYVNKEKNESQWLPPGWFEYTDTVGRKFYGNPATRITQYELPVVYGGKTGKKKKRIIKRKKTYKKGRYTKRKTIKR
jgi:hypothetical protein